MLQPIKAFKEKSSGLIRTGDLIIGHMIVNRFLIGMLLISGEAIKRMEQITLVYLVERMARQGFSLHRREIREGFFFAPQ